ncbi:UNVERIFIED_CONTAM: hypothetical protein Scaly_0583000 [Sesamum calycinum]|uniref:Uncharacterized protein n=1 Tax=Sesamum calycinum TaxID=2727403 RepID=A0AAW2RSN1_9LAMI
MGGCTSTNVLLLFVILFSIFSISFQNETSETRDLFYRKLEYDLSFANKYHEERTFVNSLKAVPSRPNPLHGEALPVATPTLTGSLRDAPSGPDPIHHKVPIVATPTLRGSLRDAPFGPDPIYYKVPLVATPTLRGSLRDAPSGPDPIHHKVPPVAASNLIS